MSCKNRDEKNRWRNKTIAFRVSPEENNDINLRVQLSGLTKQDYIILRCQQKDIIVYGNPRVYKALKLQLENVLAELKRIEYSSDLSDSLTTTIQMITLTLNGMQCKQGDIHYAGI
jgi:hypothetical protein